MAGLDWKHLAGLILGALLGLGVSALQKNGIDVSCPAAPSAVISAPAGK